MARYLTLLGVVLAILALIFQLGSFMASAVIFLLCAAVVLIGIGVITGY